uniref:Uncharacterized protein n=1 Tax=Steinernema glaseri TaxID=37863 RepID=A0A1I8AMA3_9BILA
MYDWLCKPSSPPPEFFNAPSPSEERELSGVEAARHRFDKLVREVKDAPVQRRNSECSTLESQDQKPSKRIYRSRRKADMGEI